MLGIFQAFNWAMVTWLGGQGYPRKDFQQQARPPQEGVSSPPQEECEQRQEARLPEGCPE